MDDSVIKIGTSVDISGIKASMAEAEATIKSSTSNMEAAYTQMAAATAEYSVSQANLRAVIRQLVDGTVPYTLATKALTPAIREQAEAAKSLAAAKAALAAADGTVTAAENLQTQAMRGNMSAMTAANMEMRVLEGSSMGMAKAAGSLLSTLPGMGTAMQMAFPVIGAIALLDVVGQLGKSMYEAFDMGGERARKTAQDIDTDAMSMRHMNDSLDVEIDKLQMANARLEHRPITNAMKTSIDEAAAAADALYEKLGVDLRRIEETVKGMAGSSMQQVFGVQGGTDYEQTMIQEHTRHLSEQKDMQGQLNESTRYGLSLLERKNELDAINKAAQLASGTREHGPGDPTTVAYTGYDNLGKAIQKTVNIQAAARTASVGNIQTELDATQHLIAMQAKEQSAIKLTIELDAEQKRHNVDVAKNEGTRTDNSAAQARLKAIESQRDELSAKESAVTGHGLTAGEGASFWASYLTAFKAGSEEAKHVLDEYAKSQEEMHKQLQAIKASMKKADSEDVHMESLSPELNRWILEQGDDLMRTGDRWKDYHDAVSKGAEIQAQAKEQFMLATVNMQEAGGAITKLTALHEIAAIHAQEYKDKIQALREELKRLQQEERDYEKQNAGAPNPKNIAQQQQVQNQITQAQGQAKTTGVQDNTAIEQQLEAPYLKAFDNINSAWLRVQDSMMYSTRNISLEFAKMGQSILVSTVNSLEKMALVHAEKEAMRVIAHRVANLEMMIDDSHTAAGQEAIANSSLMKKMAIDIVGLFHHATINTAKTTSDQTAAAGQAVAAATGAVAATTATTTAATTQITAHAGVAAAGAAASQASIPWVGPAIAIGAALAMEGLVMGFAKFETGTGYIPRTGMAMLHEGEAVIPAPTMRELRGSDGGSGDVTINQHNNWNTMTDREFKRHLDRHASDVAGAVRKHLRQGGH